MRPMYTVIYMLYSWLIPAFAFRGSHKVSYHFLVLILAAIGTAEQVGQPSHNHHTTTLSQHEHVNKIGTMAILSRLQFLGSIGKSGYYPHIKDVMSNKDHSTNNNLSCLAWFMSKTRYTSTLVPRLPCAHCQSKENWENLECFCI